ncbi:MAG: hypothetical protein KIG72_01210, partial [Bradymonadales bacterium]|nr:hypothetical protein [Bradymonadales bacterium]
MMANGCDDATIIAYEGDKCVPECGSAMVCCAGTCVDTNSDAYHCGKCWNQCRNHEVCDSGSCKSPSAKTCSPACDSNRRCCGETCIDVLTDPKNCGTCGVACPDGIACVDGKCDVKPTCQCSDGKVCDENGDCVVKCGSSLCRPDESCCGNTCTTLDTVKHCGSCDNACQGNAPFCQYGACADKCSPQTCEAQSAQCGIGNDGCGNAPDCGSCADGKVCTSNQCVDACTPRTCENEHKNCGTIDDGCGGKLNCGSCSGAKECKNNVCTNPECKPKTCAEQGKKCGSTSDGCGKTIQCGSCSSSQDCKNNVCVDKPTSVRDTYPVRKSIKSLQPDFQDRAQIIGNEVHGVAMNLVWAEWQPQQSKSCGANQVQYDGYCFNKNQAIIDAIREYTNHGVVVTAVVYGVPDWARRDCVNPKKRVVQAPMFCAPVDGKASDYGRFAGFVANFFNGEKGNGRVADFVIHNEVNSYMWFNIGCSDTNCNLNTWTRVYADSYNAAYDYIKKEQKNAKVLISFDHYFGATKGISYRADNFLKTLVPKLGNRDWMLAFHSYPPDLASPEFGANDYNNHGIISFGNIGVLAGWLRQNYPNDPHAWEIQLTENGINGVGASMQQRQQAQLCQAFRNVLGTPGITSFVYHRLVDHPDEVAGGLGCGLWNEDRSPKPAWTTFALANRKGVGAGWPSCGFDILPYVPLMRGYNGKKHWVTSRQFPSGVKVEQTWHILREQAPNTQLVYECRVGGPNGDHTLISTLANCENQFNMGPMGYVYKTQVAGTSPIYRCYIATTGDHFI